MIPKCHNKRNDFTTSLHEHFASQSSLHFSTADMALHFKTTTTLHLKTNLSLYQKKLFRSTMFALPQKLSQLTRFNCHQTNHDQSSLFSLPHFLIRPSILSKKKRLLHDRKLVTLHKLLQLRPPLHPLRTPLFR